VTEQEQQQLFNQWLHQYKALFFKVIRAYAFTAMDRDDLFQEITLQAWRSIPSFQQKSSVSTWLYRISFNTAITWSHKARKHRNTDEMIENIEQVLVEKEVASPDDERLNWLYKEISYLDEVDRSITLLLLEGSSYKEIAVILGISESNVGVKVHRIKKALTLKSKKIETYGI